MSNSFEKKLEKGIQTAVFCGVFLGVPGCIASNVVDTSWNRLQQSLDGSIQSLKVHDGFPYFSDERLRLTCQGTILRVSEQTALFLPMYWDTVARGNWNQQTGDNVILVPDCTRDSIANALKNTEELTFANHVIGHLDGYVSLGK